MYKLRLNLKTPCDIYIEHGILNRCGEILRGHSSAEKILLVCGDIVESLYADRVETALIQEGFCVYRFVYRHGEKSKNAETLMALLGFMADCGLSRSDMALALGGGVTGDLCGLAAALYMRGIDYAILPTTLLSMVDSSVGGKTAVDFASEKNLIGAFHQPRAVIIDPDTLGTLSHEDIAEGCAEVLKYALLCKPELCELLKSDKRDYEELIFECLKIKCGYVEADELDHGARRMLNLGHSVAHAIECLSGYSISHGRAVAAGLFAIANAAVRNGDCDASLVDIISETLDFLGLPCEYDLDNHELCKLILRDKKNSSVDIILIVPKSMGVCDIKRLAVSELYDYLFGGEA